MHLANPEEGGDDFAERRAETGEAMEKFRTVAAADGVQDIAPSKTRALTEKILTDVEELGSTRALVEESTARWQEVFDLYTELITTTHRILSSLTFLEDLGTTEELQSLARTTASRDLLAQEDALLAAGIAEGRLDAEAHSRFVQQIGAVEASYEAPSSTCPSRASNGTGRSRKAPRPSGCAAWRTRSSRPDRARSHPR